MGVGAGALNPPTAPAAMRGDGGGGAPLRRWGLQAVGQVDSGGGDQPADISNAGRSARCRVMAGRQG